MPINLSGSLILTGSLTATSSINTPVVNSPLLQNGSQYIAQDTITGITAIVNGVKSWGFYPGGTLQPAGAIVGSTFDATSVDVTQNVLLLKSLYYGAQIVTAPDGVTTQTWNFKTDGNLELPTGKYITGSLLGTASYAANADLLDNRDSSTFANTGSNIFSDGQYLSSSFNPTGFSTTASLYTDGGLRVTRDAYISGTLYLNNVTVFGTQSVAYISSSQLNIGTNLITVNTDTPSIRFGGLSVYDSGSTGLTGSILWDSQNNHWIYSNPSGSTYSGGMFISGPRTSTLGSETGTTSCMLLAGQGGDHLTSSAIYHSSTVTCIPTAIVGGSTACFASSITADSLNINTSTVFVKANIADTLTATSIGSNYNPGILNIQNKSATNGNLSLIGFQDASQFINLAAMGAINETHAGSPNSVTGALAFYTKTSGIGFISERMRITSDGSVGIGTTSPGRLLEVYSCSTDRGGFIRSSNCGTAGITSSYFEMFIGGCAMSIPTWRNAGIIEAVTTCGIVLSAFCNNIAFQVGNRSEVMRITNAGNVLLACSTDNNKGAKLQITQNASNTNAIDFKNTDVTYGRIGTFANGLYLTQNYYYAGGQNNDCSNFGQASIVVAAGTTNLSTISFALSDAGATSPSAKMIITSGGNVGIGTTDPGQKLEVVGGEIKAGRVDSSNEGGQLSFGRASDNATGWYIDAYGNTSTPSLRFVDVSNSSVRMNIDGSGNVTTAASVDAGTGFGTVVAYVNVGTTGINCDLAASLSDGTYLINAYMVRGGAGINQTYSATWLYHHYSSTAGTDVINALVAPNSPNNNNGLISLTGTTVCIGWGGSRGPASLTAMRIRFAP
jgi:hypothetical protein